MSVDVRAAKAGDLDAVASFLGRRAGLGHAWAGTRRAAFDLAPERARAWIAVDGSGRVVGLSCVERHALQVDDATLDAGCWTHVDADDAHAQAVLPPLIDATLRCGLTPIYRVCPDPADAEAHLRRGFVELERVTLRLFPLRPLTLASRRLNLPELATRAAEPLDRVAGLPLKLPRTRARELARGTSIVELSLPEDGLAIAELIARARAGQIARRWTPESLQLSHRPAPDGSGDVILGLVRRGVILGVAIYRVTTYRFSSYPDGLRAALILELVARDDDRELLAVLLHAIERRADRAQAEAVLALDALGPAVSTSLRGAGYLDSLCAQVLIAGPPQTLATIPRLGAARTWRVPLVLPWGPGG